jgi:hypothetical protein
MPRYAYAGLDIDSISCMSKHAVLLHVCAVECKVDSVRLRKWQIREPSSDGFVSIPLYAMHLSASTVRVLF